MNSELFNKKHLKGYRKELRNNMTKAESYLWKALKRKQLNERKFRRQHSIGNYIVDFYYPSENLIVELDGEVHMNTVNQDYDFKRSVFLKSKGFKLLRFENKVVFENLDMVLDAIRKEFK